MYRYTLLLLLIALVLLAQVALNPDLVGAIDDAQRAEVFYNAGRQHARDFKPEKALELYIEAVKWAPTVPHYRYRAAEVALQLKRFRPAKTLLNPRFLQDHAPSWNLYGTLLLQQAKVATAQETFIKALSFDPTNPEPYYGLAQCAETELKTKKTAAARSNAMGNYQAYLARAPYGEKRDRAEERLRELQYGQKMGKELNYAIAVFKAKEYVRSERLLKKLTQIREAYYWLGLAAQNQNHPDDALRYWEKALPSPLAQLEIARHQMASGKYNEAFQNLKTAPQREPNRVEIHLTLGIIALELEHHEEAKTWLWKVVADAPKRPEARRAQELLHQLDPTIVPHELDWSVGSLTEEQLFERYGPLLDDHALQGRLERILNRLQESLPELTHRQFELWILRSDVPMAWAVEPNKILITQELIEFVDSDSQLHKHRLTDDALGFILGHELTHLIEHDGTRISELQELTDGALTDFRLRTDLLHRAEYNADRKGALMAYQAKYDPFAGVIYFRACHRKYGSPGSDSEHPSFDARRASLEHFLTHSLTQAYDQFKRGVHWLDNPNGEKAASAFQSYLAYLPTDIEAQCNLAIAYFLRGIEALGAVPWGEWRLALGPVRHPQFARPKPRFITPGAEKWMRRAQNTAKGVLRQNPEHAPALRLLADIELAYGRYDAAKKFYRRALAIRPKDTATHNNMGVLACLEERWSDAQKQFESCLGVNVHIDAIARTNLNMLP
jgi:tetratricopeptide (TPR) repeat protein